MLLTWPNLAFLLCVGAHIHIYLFIYLSSVSSIFTFVARAVFLFSVLLFLAFTEQPGVLAICNFLMTYRVFCMHWCSHISIYLTLCVCGGCIYCIYFYKNIQEATYSCSSGQRNVAYVLRAGSPGNLDCRTDNKVKLSKSWRFGRFGFLKGIMQAGLKPISPLVEMSQSFSRTFWKLSCGYVSMICTSDGNLFYPKIPDQFKLCTHFQISTAIKIHRDLTCLFYDLIASM